MAAEVDLFVDIVIVIAIALAGGLVAHLLRLPLILGYLAAGIVIGPHVIGVITTVEEVRQLAEFGVVLLLFAVGVEISIRDIQRLGSRLVVLALGQVLLTVLAGLGLGYTFGWSWEQSIVLGFMISLSSTMVVLKTLMDRGELLSTQGRLLTGIMVVQDLLFVAMIAIVPAISESGDVSPQEIAIKLLTALVAVLIMLIVGPRILPRILERIAGVGQRELFLLSLVAITFGSAWLTQEFGLSAAVGAFLAGLALSGSDFGYRALSETVPLKDMFGALFFVSLGMLADPSSIVDSPATVISVIGVVIVLKLVVLATISRGLGFSAYLGILVGLGAAQMGEFSFVLAETSTSVGLFDEAQFSALIMAAVITMALTPALYEGGKLVLVNAGRSYSFLRPYKVDHDELPKLPDSQVNHAVVAGLGRVGSLVVESMQDQSLPVVAVETDHHLASSWRERGLTVINGPADSETILSATRIENARLLIVALDDEHAALVTAEHARRLNPQLDIVVRSHRAKESERLIAAGVDEVVRPETEAALEMVRHSLLRFQTRLDEAEVEVESLRDAATLQDTEGT